METKEHYTPTPFSERKSQNLNFWDYFKDQVVYFLIPVAGSIVGALLSKPTKGIANATTGFLASGIVTGFLLWRRDEKKRLGVADTVAEVKDIAHLHQTDEDLERDNALVEDMIAHEREKQAELLQHAPAASFQKREQQRGAESSIVNAI